MAAYNKLSLYPATVIATSTTTTGSTRQLSVHSQEISCVSQVSARTDGTYTVTIQHSADGITWFTLATGSAQSSNGSIEITVANTITTFLYVRASILSATVTTGATVTVTLYYGEQRM